MDSIRARACIWQYGAGFSIGWELDFWGRFSRAIESADAAFFAAQANRDAALVLLHAQVADTYFTLRTAEARLRIARENAQLQKRSYEITQTTLQERRDAMNWISSRPRRSIWAR